MATDRRNLELLLVGRDVSAGRVLKDLSGQAAKTESRFGTLARNAKYAAGAAGLAAIGMVARTGFSELKDYQSGLAQVTAALKSTHGAAGITAPQIEKLAHEIQNYSGQTDDSIVSTAALLLRFRNLRDEAGRGNDVFTQTVKVAADMAARLGGDAASQATKLGRALNDPIKGLTALTRVGVTFTDQQKGVITQLVASGRTMDAQKIILGELQKQYGGSAKAAGQTLGGQIAIAQRHFEDFSQELVGDALPAITKVMGVIDDTKGVLIPLGLAIGGAVVAWKAYQLAVKAAIAISTVYRTVVLNLVTAQRLAAIEGSGILGMLKNLNLAQIVAKGSLLALAAAVTYWVMQWRNASREVKQNIDEISGAIETNNVSSMRKAQKALDDMTASARENAGGTRSFWDSVKSSVNPKEWLDTIKKGPNAYNEASDAIDKYGDAYLRVQAKVDRFKDNLASLMSLYHLSRSRVLALADANNIDLSKSMTTVSGKFADVMNAAAKTHHPVGQAARDIRDAGDASKSASEQVDALRSALDLLAGKALSADDAAIAFRNDVKDLKDSLDKSGGSMDLNTQKGRDSRQSFNDAAQAALDYSSSVKDSTGSSSKAADALQASINALKGVAGSSPHAQAMLDKLRAALDKLKGSARNSGKAVDEGLASGIGDYSYRAIHAAEVMAHGVAKASAGILRIASPSKVFREYGHRIAEGLGVGIDDMGDLPVNRLRNLIGKMKDYINSAKNGLSKATEDMARDLVNKLGRTLDRFDAVSGRIANVRSNARQFAGGIRDNLLGAVDITEAKHAGTGDIIHYLRRQRRGLRDFRKDLRTLRQRGVSKEIIDQLAAAGVEQGGATAHALAVQAGKGDIAQINRLSLAIRRDARAIGTSRARADYGPRLRELRGELRGIRHDLRHIRHEINLKVYLDGKEIGAKLTKDERRGRLRKGKSAEAA